MLAGESTSRSVHGAKLAVWLLGHAERAKEGNGHVQEMQTDSSHENGKGTYMTCFPGLLCWVRDVKLLHMVWKASYGAGRLSPVLHLQVSQSAKGLPLWRLSCRRLPSTDTAATRHLQRSPRPGT